MSKQFNVLIIFRGVPGSGKTTYAKEMMKDDNCRHFENDDFFTDDNGNYHFDFKYHQKAKDQCLEKTKAALLEGKRVIVSNTFIKVDELSPYLDFCGQNGIEYAVIDVMNRFKNVHDIPESIIDQKAAEFEQYYGANGLVMKEK